MTVTDEVLNQDRNLRDYYSKRAHEYEKIYLKPERQHDLAELKNDLRIRLSGLNVLEVACGTGYWTEEIAKSANAILASDQSIEVLEIAKGKQLPKTGFVQDDAFLLNSSTGNFDAGFSGFWWSHILKAKLNDFLENFHSKLQEGAKVIFIDNLFVEGSSTPISRKDSEGNTYQLRSLEDGTKHEVLKNFPSESELRSMALQFGDTVDLKSYHHFWLLEYNLRRRKQ